MRPSITHLRRATGWTPGARGARTRALTILLASIVVISLTAGVSASTAPPACTIGDTVTRYRTLDEWGRTLLDTRYRLPASYAPADLRSTAAAGLNGGHRIRKLALADLKAMTRAARAAGVRLAVQSGYRSFSTQESTFARWVTLKGYRQALRESARPGHSEHQLGTTIDFRSAGGPAPWDVADWGTTKAGRWLAKQAWKYGFVMSYPKGKASKTCYMYEPWHYRYVGRATAEEVRDSGRTLRAHLWRTQDEPTPTPSPTPSPTPTPEPTPEVTPTPTPENPEPEPEP